MKEFDEEALVQKACYGDKGAFGELVNRYHRDIYLTIYSRTLNREDAEDLVQETFAKAFFNITQLRSPYQFKQWLRQIAINNSINWLKRQSKIQEIFLPWEESEDLRTIPYDTDEKRFEALWEGIEGLSEVNRQVILMHYFEGYTYKEIADRLRIAVPTVTSRLYEARENLRTTLEWIGSPLLFDDFEAADEVIRKRWRFKRPTEQEDKRRYQVVEVDGNRAFRLAEFTGHSAHVWVPTSAEDFVLSVDVKATQPDAIWKISAHTYIDINKFGDIAIQAFNLTYHQSGFQLYSGGRKADGQPQFLSSIRKSAILEDDTFHRYEITRRKERIHIKRDGHPILSGKDLSERESIGAIHLTGTGHLQGEGVGAYFDNLIVRAI